MAYVYRRPRLSWLHRRHQLRPELVGVVSATGVGSSVGANTATATAAPIQAKVGSAAGANTTAGVGAWLQSGVGSSAGSNTTSGVGAWLQSGVGSSAGSNTALGNKLVVTLNPSDKDTNIVLSNGNLTASLTASIGALTGVDVRATDTFASGYWEVVFTTLVTGQAHGVGIAFSNSSQALNHYPQGPNSVGYFNNGFVAKVSGSTTVTGFAQGDVVGAWLVGDGSLQYFVNGVNVYTDTTIPTGNLYPCVCLANDTESGTVNFGATAMSYLPPGVSSWDRSRVGVAAGAGSSAGANATTAVGSWLQSGVGNAAGANTTSGYSAAVANVGTSAGANTSTAVGAWLQAGVGSSAGTDTATAVSQWFQSGVGASAGTNTAAAVSSLAGVTWNPSDKSVDVTLSGGNLTATRSSTSTGVNDVQARANTGRTSGGYFEIVFSTVVGGAHNPGIGLGNLSQSVNDYPGHTANSIGWFANGFFRGPSGVQSAPSFIAGDVIGCELTASTAKFYKNGTLVATESSLPTGTLYPLISLASVFDAGTANFGATSMAYLPIGVVSWDGSRTGSVTNVGTAAGSNTSTAVSTWIKASVGSAVGGNVASATSSEADFNNDYDQSFAGFPGAEAGLGTGDFNNDFNNDYAVFHVGNIVSGVGTSVGGNIAAAVSSTAIYVPPVTPPPPIVAPQVWYPAREYTRVQAPRAIRTYRTGTELKRSTPQGMKRRYG